MPKNNPTIYDVAKEAGVSIATVSRVVNSPHQVHPKTRTTILEVIDRLGYISQGELNSRTFIRTKRIGVLIPFFTTPSFVQRLRGIAGVLNQNNYELVIYPVDTRSREISTMETLAIRHTLDGLIVVSQVFDDSIANRLIENSLETVVIEFFDPRFTSLEIDDEQGGYLATKYLLGKGYHRIVFIGGSQEPEFGVDPIIKRLAGYRKALKEEGITLPPEYENEYVLNPGDLLDKIKPAKDLPIAFFAATDMQAISLISECRKRELRIPEDVALIGFDDIDMAEYFGLTSVHQPLDESGRIAAELLISRLINPTQTIQHITLPLKVVERVTA